MTRQVRPASGKGAPSSGGTGAKKSGGAGKPAPATAAGAATDELKQKAELLERGLRNEELARNAMQLERVGMKCCDATSAAAAVSPYTPQLPASSFA